MSYDLLTSLYFGEGSNADLTKRSERERIHVSTPLERLVPEALAAGVDVVLTGNPGDGKSHLARTLVDRGAHRDAEVILDLSERPTKEVLTAWEQARRAGRRLLLCGNEGPLLELIAEMARSPQLSATGGELRDQVGRLVADHPAALAPEPRTVMLIDLADRSVLDARLVDVVLKRASVEEFLPDLGPLAVECSAGRNLLMLQDDGIRGRLARLIALAGRRAGEHVTFRQLWAAVAYAISAGRAVSTLRVELSRAEDGLLPCPLDNLANPKGRGLLIEAARAHADPAVAPEPDLDEALWSTGQPEAGRWTIDFVAPEPPAALWARGERREALQRQRQLKRLVALAHERGDALVSTLERAAALPSGVEDAQLRAEVVLGLRRLYLTPLDEDAAPAWLSSGLPLWLGYTYESDPVESRPHVAVRSVPEREFEVRRPVRAPWLRDALGPPPEVAWLHHAAADVSLRVDPRLLAALRRATHSTGPVEIPEPAHRFLVRLAGWDDATHDRAAAQQDFAVLQRPRGGLVAAARVRKTQEGGWAYAESA